MSAKLNIIHAKILENPAPLEAPLKLEIQFEAYEDIAEGKLVIVVIDAKIFFQRLIGSSRSLERTGKWSTIRNSTP